MKINFSSNYKSVINIILILNILDLILTYIGLEIGYFVEGNVLMANLYEFNKYYFIGLKVIIILLFSIICYKFYDRISLKIKRLFWIPLTAYSYVTILHLLILILTFK